MVILNPNHLIILSSFTKFKYLLSISLSLLPFIKKNLFLIFGKIELKNSGNKSVLTKTVSPCLILSIINGAKL